MFLFLITLFLLSTLHLIKKSISHSQLLCTEKRLQIERFIKSETKQNKPQHLRVDKPNEIQLFLMDAPESVAIPTFFRRFLFVVLSIFIVLCQLIHIQRIQRQIRKDLQPCPEPGENCDVNSNSKSLSNYYCCY